MVILLIDYLYEFSLNTNIALNYTNNIENILFTTVYLDKPTINANIIFKNCPRGIAYFIFKYYILNSYEEETILKLKNFISSKLPNTVFSICPPSDAFKTIVKKIDLSMLNYTVETEMSIKNISIKAPDGKSKIISANSVIVPPKDSLPELDIVVTVNTYN